MNSSPKPGEFRDFLLDRLPPEQAEAIEERMFQDETYFSDLQDAEDELIEEYVTEELDPSETQLFRARVERDPNLQQRVAIRRVLIRTLQRSASEAAAPAVRRFSLRFRSRFLVPGFALAILILGFVSWKAIHRRELPSQATGTPAQGSTGNRPEAMLQAAAAIFLPAHVARGASRQTSVLHLGGAAIVKLELETPSADAAARWEVRVTSESGSVFSVGDLAPQQAGVVSFVVAQVPALQLPPKVYQVTLAPQSASSGAVPSSWELQVVQ
ncbi:MAG TPA: hypothetical protein VFE06_00425 [Acidobacteriaceae bacterium]|jgi:hypothetical protein|nr:hypothetical protein [Acidobacteriaceae bacterium]